MAQIIVPITEKTQENNQIIATQLSKKSVEFAFVAGQFMRVILPQVTDDPRGNGRFFSIAAAPSDDFLLFATTVSQSPFKQALVKLQKDEMIQIVGPFGKFVLEQDTEKEHVFLCGGIGITPFHSMLKDATVKKLPHKITLLYSNKTPSSILFKNDLDSFAQINPNLTIVYTLTQPQLFQTPWSGHVGRIDEAMIKTYVKDLRRAVFYACGPPTMVQALQTMVKNMGVSEENIKIELFTGYQ